MSDDWTYETSAGRPVARGVRGSYALYVIDHQKSDTPVRWYVGRVGMFFDLDQGEARTLAEGQAAAEVAAERLRQEHEARAVTTSVEG